MRTTRFTRVVALILSVALTACSDTRGGGIATSSEPAVNSAPSPRPDLNTANAACTPVTETQLKDLAVLAFGAGSPDVQSVIGKIGSLADEVAATNSVAAAQKGYDILEFTLRKNSQRALGGSPEQIKTFLNAVACFAGIDFVIDDLNGTVVVNPTDGARIIYSGDRLAGISLAANTLQEPTIFSIVPIPFTAPLGEGPLNTKLDQYRGFFNFTKASANNLPFLQPVVVGVCAPANLVELTGVSDIFSRLRLGHDVTSTVFRIEPLANADFLNCATAYLPTTGSVEKATDFFSPGFMGRVASLFTPRVAFAATADAFFAGGGIGGLASELSPFAPVDATVSFAGGIGGLASELRVLTLQVAEGSCSGTEAPVGNDIEAACRPKVVLTTELGTPLAGAPVTFTATVGNGAVALQNAAGSCGTFGTSVIATTLADGTAQVCWRLGTTAGTNRLRAVGGIGGDVPAGTTYEDARFFTATGNPPSGFAIIEGPAAGANVVAGTAIPVRAALVDADGVVVTNFTGQVTLALRRAGAAASFAPGSQVTATAVNGVATFAPVSINAAGTGYSLRATGTFASVAYTGEGNSFNVVAATAASITKVLGDAQSAPANTLLPVAPTVLVRDAFGNPVEGAVVSWSAGGNTGGSVSAPTSTTLADGRASIRWTIGTNPNELLATTSTLTALFTATANTPALTVLNQCLPTGSGDPLNDPAKPFAFYIPDPGPNKTIREITVFLSSSGQANATTRHDMRLTLTRNTFNPADTSARFATATAFLRGNNAETKPVTFVLSQPIVGSNNTNARLVMMRLSTFGPNSADAKLNFNSGPCSPNSTSCRVPNICKVTEVSNPRPYPLGVFYRQSVGITVRGN